MNCWNSLTDNRHGRFCVHTFALCSQSRNTSGPHRTWGSHSVFGGHVCIVFSDTIVLPKEASEHLSQCQAPQNPGPALPRVQVIKRGRALPLAPQLLREHCWTSRHWRRPGSEGRAAHLPSGRRLAKAKVGRSKNKKQACW